MDLFFLSTVLFSALLAPLSGLRVLKPRLLNCTHSGLICKATTRTAKCFDKNHSKIHNMTPSGPLALKLDVEVRQDATGASAPMIVITWMTQSDGSIGYLKGTEVHILKVSTNFRRCVRYMLLEKIDTSKRLDNWWFFSLDQVVVDPEETYVISVFNIPRPNLGHDSYYVAENITIPGCQEAIMRKAKVCIEMGSLWEPNANLTKEDGVDGSSTVTVSFYSEQHCDRYRVFVQCPDYKQHQDVLKENETLLKAVFDRCPASCFVLNTEIQPFFAQCKNTCVRHRKTFNLSLEDPASKSVPPLDHMVLASKPLGIVLLCILLCWATLCCYSFWCRRRQKGSSGEKTSAQDSSNALKNAKDPDMAKGPRKVLIIYSLDHPLYKDIVLKLCAFLQAQCGTEAILDLLDSAQLSTMGRLPWLELQKERVEETSDKILILCSRGTQAKWQAMCGGQRVMLKEDACSPTGDMLTPAFSIIMPDLLHTAAFGKYVVAYFGGVCCEEDIPSPFNITVKYKLMNHFEDVYLRILDKDKLEPWKMNHVEGITENEYHKCPSGGALRDAIEAFQAYQLEHPDWFEKECMNNTEELAEFGLQDPLLEETYSSCIYSFVPQREGVPLNVHEVEIIEDERYNISLRAITNNREEGKSVTEFHPARNSRQCPLYSLHPQVEDVASAGMCSSAIRDQLCLKHVAEIEVQGPLMPTEDGECQQEHSAGQNRGVENEDELQPRPDKVPSCKAFVCPLPVSPLLDSIDKPSHPPVREQQEGKRCLSGSDQGYVSRTSLQSEAFSPWKPAEIH